MICLRDFTYGLFGVTEKITRPSNINCIYITENARRNEMASFNEFWCFLRHVWIDQPGWPMYTCDYKRNSVSTFRTAIERTTGMPLIVVFPAHCRPLRPFALYGKNVTKHMVRKTQPFPGIASRLTFRLCRICRRYAWNNCNTPSFYAREVVRINFFWLKIFPKTDFFEVFFFTIIKI